MKTVFSRLATCPMARPDADEISPMIIATLSRSISRSALVDAVCGLTESSITSSILRPMTPPELLISSAASLTPMTAYSPSGPRKPVSGVRCPMRMASACARTTAGMPTPASNAAPALPLMSERRDSLDIMDNPPCKDLGRFERGCGRGFAAVCCACRHFCEQGSSPDLPALSSGFFQPVRRERVSVPVLQEATNGLADTTRKAQFESHVIWDAHNQRRREA